MSKKEENPGLELAKVAFEALEDGKALNPVILDMRGKSSFTDYIMICSGSSGRQTKALSHRVHKEIKSQLKKNSLGIEGTEDGNWILLDFGDMVLHIFLDEIRDFYSLEELWHDVPQIKV